MITGAVLVALLAAAAWAARSWRRGLEAALILLVFEGAVRKWLVPEASNYVYFGKDLILLGVYVGFFRDRARRHVVRIVPQGFVVLLGLVAAIALLQVFNPRLPTPLVGALGFKAYVFYLPLLWVVPAAFRDEQEFAGFVRRYLAISIPIGLFAAVQFFSPTGSALNTYVGVGGEEGSLAIATFGNIGRVRVTSTFSFITGYSAYLQVTSLLVLTVLTVRRWRFRGSIRYLVALGVVVLGMLMTGSRGPVLLLVLLLPVYWFLGVVREGGAPVLGRFLLAIALVVSVVNFVGSDAVEAFRARAAGADDVWERIIGPFTNPLRIASEIGFLGYGTGATHQVAEVVTDSWPAYSWLEGHRYEDEPSRVMVELGMFGFVSFFAVRIGLIVLALRTLLKARRPLPRAVALSCLLLFLSQLVGGVVFNVTADVYYWFFGGLLFLAVRLEREALAATRAQGRERPGRARAGASRELMGAVG